MKKLVCWFFVLFTPWAVLPAATSLDVDLGYYLPEGVEYNPDIPKPAEVIGFEPGAWHLRHDQLVRYLETVADASDRMVLTRYGQSHEEKSLHLLIVGSEKNLARLDAIQSHQQWLLDPRGTPPLSDPPLVIWMGYSIHGNEPSGANAVPIIAYHLAAAQGDGEVDELLREAVVLIDPVFNPDGLDRFAHWANVHRGINTIVADPNHREHREMWPSGRFNHYWFDLNRDWMPLVHPESRGRLEQYHLWRPHVLTDYHEMGTDRSYFFQPGVPSRNNPLTPERNYELTADIAGFNARALDEIGSLYYTRETFDDFYVGKGSTYPDLNGTIGILFEQASSRGHAQENSFGGITFPFTIRNQFTTTLGTFRASLAMREELKEFSKWFYRSAAEEAREYSVKAYLFEAPADPAAKFAFFDLLQRHQINVHRLARDTEAGGRSFSTENSFLVPLEQPQYRLARSLFEVLTEFEESAFYDISTWVLPSSFNIDTVELGASALSGLLGEQVETVERPRGEWIGGESGYAYLIAWDGIDSARAVHRLLREGILVRVANRPLTMKTPAGETAFTAGTVLVPLGINPGKTDRIHEILREAVREDSVRVHAVNSGLAVSGIDLGSPSFDALEERKVLVAVGSGVSPLRAGEIWHFFDQHLHVGVSLVELTRINSLDLSRYNTIVLPDGTYGDITDGGVENLRHWIRRGGTVVALQRAANWAVGQNLASASFASPDRSRGPADERLPYADADTLERLKRISGAIVIGEVDTTHPVGYGLPKETMHLFRMGTTVMERSSNPYLTPVAYRGEPLYSGYISDENQERLGGSAAVTVSHSGSGRVVLFMDTPLFRGYWLGSARLFVNSVFFGSSMSSVSLSDEAAHGDEHGH